MYRNDDFMDELLEMLHENPFQKKEKIQNIFLVIRENSQHLIMSSLTESDISQNHDSISYISFSEIDDNLQHSCNIFVTKKEVGTINLIFPHIIQLRKFCYKKRLPISNQKIPFCRSNFFKVLIFMWMIT